MMNDIRMGDRVWVKNRFGQIRSGKAVMKGTYGWVLNMGGRHGTPEVVTEKNFVKVKKSN